MLVAYLAPGSLWIGESGYGGNIGPARMGRKPAETEVVIKTTEIIGQKTFRRSPHPHNPIAPDGEPHSIIGPVLTPPRVGPGTDTDFGSRVVGAS